LGEDPIMSLGDESKGARLCNRRWPASRDAVLRAHPWNCCMAQAELAASVHAPKWRWEHQYVLPTDCLRVVRVAGTDGTEVSNWEIQGQVVLCDEPAPLMLAYVCREDNPKRYDPLLSETLSARLAAMLAYPLTGSTALADSFWGAYQDKLGEARSIDAREGVPGVLCATQWVDAKNGIFNYL